MENENYLSDNSNNDNILTNKYLDDKEKKKIIEEKYKKIVEYRNSLFNNINIDIDVDIDININNIDNIYKNMVKKCIICNIDIDECKNHHDYLKPLNNTLNILDNYTIQCGVCNIPNCTIHCDRCNKNIITDPCVHMIFPIKFTNFCKYGFLYFNFNNESRKYIYFSGNHYIRLGKTDINTNKPSKYGILHIINTKNLKSFIKNLLFNLSICNIIDPKRKNITLSQSIKSKKINIMNFNINTNEMGEILYDLNKSTIYNDLCIDSPYTVYNNITMLKKYVDKFEPNTCQYMDGTLDPVKLSIKVDDEGILNIKIFFSIYAKVKTQENDIKNPNNPRYQIHNNNNNNIQQSDKIINENVESISDLEELEDAVIDHNLN